MRNPSDEYQAPDNGCTAEVFRVIFYFIENNYNYGENIIDTEQEEICLVWYKVL
jgi:hypothetical protein